MEGLVMTQEEKRIKLAEAMGWDMDPAISHGWISHGSWCKSPSGELLFRHSIPDYFNDLSACHDAEALLEVGKHTWEGYTILQGVYYRHLGYRVPEMGGSMSERPQALAHATAAKRAEALGLTLNLWKAGE